MANAYEAGAAGLPCAIFRGYRGAGLARVNPNIRCIDCPFTGEELAAVPSVRPDVTFIHAQKANKRGDVLVEGIIGVQKEAVLAARTRSRDRRGGRRRFQGDAPQRSACCRTGRWRRSASCPAARIPPIRTAITSATTPAYLEWDRISADREAFAAWMKANVLEAGPEVFAARVARF